MTLLKRRYVYKEKPERFEKKQKINLTIYNYSDKIFARDKIPYVPIDKTLATVISCEESRDFLKQMGISGEIVTTTSHSEDSVSLILDNDDCFVGHLEPFEYIAVYEDNIKLKKDWEVVLSFQPERIYYSHRPEKRKTQM